MKQIKAVIQHIAPTLASALGGPFAGVATKFITDNLIGDDISDDRSSEEIINDLLDDPVNLQKIKAIDQQFKFEMEKLAVDVFLLEIDDRKDARDRTKSNQKPQVQTS